MRFCFVMALLLGTTSAMAFCPFSQQLFSTLKETSAIVLYKNCAEEMNDDASQARLAAIYDKGTSTIPQDMKKALYYYQLSADNGNAESQARLAQLYGELDKTREGRSALHGYLKSITRSSDVTVSFIGGTTVRDKDEFDGRLMHPYVLLMLANEKPSNKWYYPTEVKKAPAYATTLFKSYKIDDEKKKQLMRQATAWKKRKLLEMGRQILTKEEYQTFVATLYPEKGQTDEFKRNQILKAFQEKVSQKKQEDAESAQAFY